MAAYVATSSRPACSPGRRVPAQPRRCALAAPLPVSLLRAAAAPLGGVPGAGGCALPPPRCLPSGRRNLLLRAADTSAGGELSLPRPDFELKQAINAAAFAFETYDSAEVLAKYRHFDGAGTYTSYLHKPFLQQRFSGLLHVHLASASALPGRDAWGTSDPYAAVRVGESAHRSATKWTSLDPVWGEDFYLYVGIPPESQRLEVRMFNENLVASDNGLGMARAPLAPLLGAGERKLVLPLEGDGGGGEVKLRVEFEAFNANGAADSKGDEAGGGEEPFAPKTLAAWRCLATRLSKGCVPSDYDTLCYMENVLSDTQLWVYRNTAAREVVVAFRGTEQDKAADLLTDVNLTPAGWNPERAGSGWLGMMPNKDEPQVHGGFLAAYDSVRGRVMSLVSALVSDLGKDEDGSFQPWRVLVTGHSLGGALATLCSYELAQRFQQWEEEGRCDGVSHTVQMYNFGSPRVGNTAFAREYDQLVPDAWRVVNTGDIVATVPRLIGYRHVGGEVRLSQRGDGGGGGGGGGRIPQVPNLLGFGAFSPLTSSTPPPAGTSPAPPGGGPARRAAGGSGAENEDDGCGPGALGGGGTDMLGCSVEALDILPVLLSEEDARRELVEGELAKLQALQSGAAIEEHMEGFYY